MKCIIGACVYNAEKYLPNALTNLDKLKTIFGEYKIVFSCDEGNDNSLTLLTDYKKEDPNVVILRNYKPMFNIITVNIANARNKILDHIFHYHPNTDFFIMIDLNYIHNEELHPEILEKYLYRDDWDGLSFNKNEYYDIWALSVDPYFISMWHWRHPAIAKDHMKKYVEGKLRELKDNELLECISAFCGFSIYKTNKFKNCSYTGLFDRDKLCHFGIDILKNIKAFKNHTYPLGSYHPPDCEHKYFHMEAIHKHGAKIRISAEKLFY